MKKIICLLFTMILIGSLLLIPISAADDEIQQYGHYISPGTYIFDEVLDFSYFSGVSDFVLSVDFVSNGVLFNWLLIGSGENSYLSYQPGASGVYRSYGDKIGWSDEAYRYITVFDGFYIYDSLLYLWFVNNTVRSDAGYDSDFFDGILSSFTMIGQWISSAVNNLTSMFWFNGSLTFYGVLCIAALSLSVIFLLIGFISIFLRFRR